MSFLRGFLTGAAKQYNANVAAQKKEDADIRALETEYGFRQRIENQKSRAASLLSDKQFEDDMFLKAIEAENSERLERIKGEEERKTEQLKATLDGKPPAMAFSLGKVNKDGTPVTVTIPTFEGKTQDDIVAKEFVWLNNNGMNIYNQLAEENPSELPKFRSYVSNLWLQRTGAPDVVSENPQTGEKQVIDILPMFPGVAQLIDADKELYNGIATNVGDLKRRLRRVNGLPEGDSPRIDQVQTPSSPTGSTTTMTYPNYPDWMRGEDGQVDPIKFENLRLMAVNTATPEVVDTFVTFMEQSFPGDNNLKAKYTTFVEIDNQLKPTDGFDYSLIPQETYTSVGRKLTDMRYASPENLHTYLTFVAMNDEDPVSSSYTPGQNSKVISAKQAKDLYSVDVADANSKVRANLRVVNLTKGIITSVNQGGKPGIAGKLELFTSGIRSNITDIKEAGAEVIGLLTDLETRGIYAGETQAERDANRVARQQNLNVMRDVQSRIERGLNVDQTALLLYYSTMLAYAGAVAVQGGDAAARTVSDQDVQRVAAGIAPAADQNFVSIDQLVAVTETFGFESREQAVIYGGMSTETGPLNRQRMKASILYRNLYGKDPFNFREYIRANNESVYNATLGTPGTVRESTMGANTGTTNSRGAGIKFFMDQRANKTANIPPQPLTPTYPTQGQ